MADLLPLLTPALKAAGLVALGWFLGRWLRTALGRFLDGRVDPTTRSILLLAARPAALLLVLPPALDQVGVSMSSALAVLSTAGLAIALAIRDSLSNVASGAIVLTVRPFGVGDNVTLGTITGRVQRIGFLTTAIDTEDGRRVHITNDRVLANPMEHHGVNGRTRVEVALRIPAERLDGALLHRLHEVAREVGGEHAEVLPTELDGDHVRLLVRGHGPLEDGPALRQGLLLRLLEALRATSPEV